jgi:hypothetical protein
MPINKTDKSTGQTGYLRFLGYFDWPGLYALLTSWANKEMYKIYEHVYKDKTSAEGFTERELEWYLEKKVDRLNKYIIKITIKMWDCQKVEVTQNEEKKILDRGRIRVLINTEIERDWQKKFEKSPTFEMFWKVYDRITTWDWNFDHWDALYSKKYELHDEVKKHLGLDTQ